MQSQHVHIETVLNWANDMAAAYDKDTGAVTLQSGFLSGFFLGHYASMVNSVAVADAVMEFYQRIVPNENKPLEGALAGVDMIADLFCEEAHDDEQDDRHG